MPISIASLLSSVLLFLLFLLFGSSVVVNGWSSPRQPSNKHPVPSRRCRQQHITPTFTVSPTLQPSITRAQTIYCQRHTASSLSTVLHAAKEEVDTTSDDLFQENTFGVSYIGGDPCGSKYNNDPFDSTKEDTFKPGFPDDMKSRIAQLAAKKLEEQNTNEEK